MAMIFLLLLLKKVHFLTSTKPHVIWRENLAVKGLKIKFYDAGRSLARPTEPVIKGAGAVKLAHGRTEYFVLRSSII